MCDMLQLVDEAGKIQVTPKRNNVRCLMNWKVTVLSVDDKLKHVGHIDCAACSRNAFQIQLFA